MMVVNGTSDNKSESTFVLLVKSGYENVLLVTLSNNAEKIKSESSISGFSRISPERFGIF